MVQSLNWEDLKYFNAVAQTLSIRRAAEINKISAATLSRRVVNLEERLGDPLFIRRANRLSLTPLGREILLQVEQVHSKVKTIETRCGMGDGKYKIRIRIPDTYATTHLIPLLCDASNRREQTTFVINSDTRVEELDSEQDDLLVTFRDVEGEAYERSSLAPVHLGLYRAKGSQFSDTLVLWNDNGPEADFLNSKLREILPDARGVAVVDGVEAYMEAVAQGLGVGMICNKAANRLTDCNRLEALPYRIERRLWLYRRKEAQPSSIIRRLERQILALDAQKLSQERTQIYNYETPVSD